MENNEVINEQPESGLTKDEKLYGMLCHLLALSTLVGAPLGSVLGPLIIWLIKKDESPFIDYNGKESLNFHLTLLIGYVISAFLSLVVIGVVFIVILAILEIVYTVIASIKTNNGETYAYPFSIKFIK